jgi:hypothetical protein
VVKLQVEGSEWFKANAEQSAFVRVKYSGDLYGKLTRALESLALSPVDRIGLQSDAFALAQAGFMPTIHVCFVFAFFFFRVVVWLLRPPRFVLFQALTLAKSYINEVDYTVWADLSSNLGQCTCFTALSLFSFLVHS